MTFFSAIRSKIFANSPASPASGEALLYPKSDGWYQNIGGVETKVGASSGTGGGLMFVSRQSSQGFWGNTSIPNAGAAYTNEVVVAPSSRPNANMVYVAFDMHAQAQGDINQAVDYHLQVNVNNTGYTEIATHVTHNNGGPSNDLGAVLTAWVPFSPGVTVAFRILINIEGGGPTVIFGMGNVDLTWFISGGTSVTATPQAADTGWINLSLSAGWGAYPGGHRTPQYRRIGNQVFLRGLLLATSARPGGDTLANLAVGWRPTQIELFEVQSSTSTGSRIDVNPTGTVVITPAIVNGGWVSLAGLQFWLD